MPTREIINNGIVMTITGIVIIVTINYSRIQNGIQLIILYE